MNGRYLLDTSILVALFANREMDRTLTIEIPEKVYEPLLQAARRVGRTPQELVRKWLIREVQAALEDPVEKFIGAFRSNVPDWADQHDEYRGMSMEEERLLERIAINPR